MITLDLRAAMDLCGPTGMPPSILKGLLDSKMQPFTRRLQLALNRGQEVDFIIHSSDSGGLVLTCTDLIKSGDVTPDSIDFECIPEILAKLQLELSDDEASMLKAVQFPHAFKVQGRCSDKTRRAHFNQFCIYKDKQHKLNAVIIDSTQNPIGIHNPVLTTAQSLLPSSVSSFAGSILPAYALSVTRASIISGEELQQSKLSRLLTTSIATSALCSLFNLNADAKLSTQDKRDIFVNLNYPILTGVQPSFGDKACGIYVANSLVHLVNVFLFGKQIDYVVVSDTVHTAHRDLSVAIKELATEPSERAGLSR